MRTPEDAPTDVDRLIRLGTVASVDLVGARCTVTLESGVVTPPLKWLEARAGKTSTWSPSSEGEQVVLLCPGGEIGAGLILRGVPSTANPAPGATLAELTKYEDGAVIGYDPQAHALTVTLPAGATAAITAPGGVTINGPVSVNGDLTATGTVTGQIDVIAAGISGKGHKHGGVESGGSETEEPQ